MRRTMEETARAAADNILKNGGLCPADTDGDGDCGRRMCPWCGEFSNAATRDMAAQRDPTSDLRHQTSGEAVG